MLHRWLHISRRQSIQWQLIRWAPAFLWPSFAFTLFVTLQPGQLQSLAVSHTGYQVADLPPLENRTVASAEQLVYFPGTYRLARLFDGHESEVSRDPVKLFFDSIGSVVLDLSGSRYFLRESMQMIERGDTITVRNRGGDKRSLLHRGGGRLAPLEDGNMIWKPDQDTVWFFKLVKFLRQKNPSRAFWDLNRIFTYLGDTTWSQNEPVVYALHVAGLTRRGKAIDWAPVYLFARDSLWINGELKQTNTYTVGSESSLNFLTFSRPNSTSSALVTPDRLRPEVRISRKSYVELSFHPHHQARFSLESLGSDADTWRLDVLPESNVPPVSKAALVLPHIWDWSPEHLLVIESAELAKQTLKEGFPKAENPVDFLIKTSKGFVHGLFEQAFTMGATEGPVFVVNRHGYYLGLIGFVLVASLLPLLYTSLSKSIASIPMLRALIVVLLYLGILKLLFSIRANAFSPYEEEPLAIARFFLLSGPFVLWLIYGWFTNQVGFADALWVIGSVLAVSYVLLDTQGFVLQIGFVLLFLTVVLLKWLRSRRMSIRSMPALDTTPRGWIVIMLVGTFSIAALMLFTGTREAIYIFGPRIQISIVALPFAIIAIAFPVSRFLGTGPRWHLLEDQRGVSWGQPQSIGLVFLAWWLCIIVYSTVSADAGFFLAYCVPLGLVAALVIALRSFAISNKRRRLIGFLVGSLLPVSVVMALLYSVVLVEWWRAESLQYANYSTLRHLAAISPKLLSDIGTITSERIFSHLQLLQTYTQTGFLGEGFGSLPVLRDFRVTALNDAFPAIFVLGDFGILGAVGLLSAFALIPALVALMLKQHAPAFISAREFTALFSSMTILGTGCYMFLMHAQVPIAPYTGKNVFLFGLNSWGDTIQFITLVLLSCYPLLNISRYGYDRTRF